jgi:hypothetical protein
MGFGKCAEHADWGGALPIHVPQTAHLKYNFLQIFHSKFIDILCSSKKFYKSKIGPLQVACSRTEHERSRVHFHGLTAEDRTDRIQTRKWDMNAATVHDGKRPELARFWNFQVSKATVSTSC